MHGPKVTITAEEHEALSNGDASTDLFDMLDAGADGWQPQYRYD